MSPTGGFAYLDATEGLVTAAVPDRDPEDLPRPEPGDLLTGRRRVLAEALDRKSAKCHRAIRMYLEAIRALGRNDGPESLHVAAYELREFMNALPQVLDLPVVPHQQLIAKVQSLVIVWYKHSDGSKCFNGGEWDGPIDDHLKKLLGEMSGFFEWVEQDIPSRKAESASFLTRLLPTSDPLPVSLMKMRTDEWSDLLKYFNYYAHHNGDPDPVDFWGKVERLEIFLLDHLEPRTFDDQEEIDQLIREAEGS